MKNKSILLIISLLTLASMLTACAGGSSASSWPGLTMDAPNDTAYLAYGQYVYAIDLTTHEQKWKFPTKGDSRKSFYAAPMLTPDGQLLAGGYDRILYSLNPVSGLVNAWNWPTKHRFVASPLVTDKAIYAATTDGSLYALDFTGKPLWAKPFKAKGAIWAKPATLNECECLYVASMDHRLYALNIQNGAVLWEKNLGGAIVGTPAINDGKIYVGTFAKELVTVDANNGTILGQPFATDGWVWAGPALAGDRLYFGDLKGYFYILNTSDGTSQKIQADGSILSTPLVISDTVYFTTQAGSLYTVDQDGKAIRPPVTIKGKLYASPVAYKDQILVTPVDGEVILMALDDKGNQLWVFPPPKVK